MFASDPAAEEVAAELRMAEPERMTPMQALLLVQRLKDRLL
jgi:hypothetical protein